MSAMRVHELAKEFGMTSKELLDRLQAMKIPAKNHASTLVDAYVDKIRKELGPEIAERQAAIEAERAAEEAAEAAAKAEEEARRKADEEARRKAEEAERKAREEERRAREEEQRRLEEEARKRAEEEQAAREEAETADARGVIEAAAAAPVAEPAPVVEAAPAPVAEAPVVEEAPAPAKPAGKMSALEAAIAAEAARLESEKAAAKAVEQEKIEEQRYRDMAREAEALQRDRVIEEAKAAVAQAQAEGGRKKKKKHKKTGEENVEAHLHDEATHVDLPCGGDSVTVTEGATVGEFADLLGVPANDVIKRLFLLGTPLTVNQPMMRDMLEIIGEDMGREIRVVKPEEETGWTFEDKAEDLKPRPPVVTVMGHVDHGKTSLLDAIRETGVAATEAGGITQHIGASVVHKNGRQITFIDTPGHEAFTAMRARGANITDIVILVVAADDGVMPQTVEAIHHAKAAGVPIIVAVNKIDKDGANPETVKQMLTEHEIVPEEWGGTNIFVNVSAKKRINIEDLLEMVLLQADVLELTANPDAHASGVVIEANLDKGRGPVATVLVQRGTLRVGDTLVAGTTYGRVRALIDPLGKTVDSAGPADPVEILGLNAVPSAGDEFRVFADERDARNLAEDRALKQRLVAQAKTKKHVSLDDLFDRIAEGELKDLNLVVKADVQGSIEALKDALDKMDQTEVRINVIHNGVGGITESDVMLADASDAIIIGFNVRPVPGAKQLAEKENVDIRTYRVIYQAIEEINAARVGLLSPDIVEQETAHIEVRELFRVPKVGVIAGCYVMDGEISRDDQVRIVRDGTVIYEGKMASLRRFKEDVKTVKSGYECGIGVEGYQDLKEGDIIEGFKTIEVAREA